jgi:hypothetical protein
MMKIDLCRAGSSGMKPYWCHNNIHNLTDLIFEWNEWGAGWHEWVRFVWHACITFALVTWITKSNNLVKLESKTSILNDNKSESDSGSSSAREYNGVRLLWTWLGELNPLFYRWVKWVKELMCHERINWGVGSCVAALQGFSFWNEQTLMNRTEMEQSTIS